MNAKLLLACASLALAGVAHGQETAEPSIDGSGAAKCTCYYSRDCSSGQTCGGMGNCVADGKKDGSCSQTVPAASVSLPNLSSRKAKHSTAKEDRAALQGAVDAYFQAFLKAIERGGGRPDPKLVQAALKTPLSKAGRDRVEYAVWVSMDAVMGWDFMYPSKFLRASGFVGNIREVNGVSSAAGIVEATRRGILDAIESGDATKINAPLREFWAKNPTYMPHHLGRCYPHGHSEVTDSATSVSCQADTIERVAAMLIKQAGS
jgi:hypothetical protein